MWRWKPVKITLFVLSVLLRLRLWHRLGLFFRHHFRLRYINICCEVRHAVTWVRSWMTFVRLALRLLILVVTTWIPSLVFLWRDITFILTVILTFILTIILSCICNDKGNPELMFDNLIKTKRYKIAKLAWFVFTVCSLKFLPKFKLTSSTLICRTDYSTFFQFYRFKNMS